MLGRGISKQSCSLKDRIFEVDGVARGDERVVEMHPEVSFAALKGAPLEFAKKSWNGQQERRRLLGDAGMVLPDQLDATAGEVPRDDILEAAAVAWSARRYSCGQAQRLHSRKGGSD
ncbi:MAG: DUF429 domain-containing protein [Planctomycetota bacterium]